MAVHCHLRSLFLDVQLPSWLFGRSGGSLPELQVISLDECHVPNPFLLFSSSLRSVELYDAGSWRTVFELFRAAPRLEDFDFASADATIPPEGLLSQDAPSQRIRLDYIKNFTVSSVFPETDIIFSNVVIPPQATLRLRYMEDGHLSGKYVSEFAELVAPQLRQHFKAACAAGVYFDKLEIDGGILTAYTDSPPDARELSLLPPSFALDFNANTDDRTIECERMLYSAILNLPILAGAEKLCIFGMDSDFAHFGTFAGVREVTCEENPAVCDLIEHSALFTAISCLPSLACLRIFGVDFLKDGDITPHRFRRLVKDVNLLCRGGTVKLIIEDCKITEELIGKIKARLPERQFNWDGHTAIYYVENGSSESSSEASDGSSSEDD